MFGHAIQLNKFVEKPQKKILNLSTVDRIVRPKQG